MSRAWHCSNNRNKQCETQRSKGALSSFISVCF